MTIVNTLVAFGFGIIISSAWNHEANEFIHALGYAITGLLSGIFALIVYLMTIINTHNLGASNKAKFLMSMIVIAGIAIGLFVSILPNLTWILSSLFILILMTATIIGEGLGIISKQYEQSPAGEFSELNQT